MNAFIEFLDGLLGAYTPVVDSSGIIPSGFAGVDFPYVFRAVIFVVVLYSLLKCIGGLICRTY